MEKVYIVTYFYQDYEYPDTTHTNIVGAYSNLEDAETAVKEEILKTYDPLDFESDEEFDEFIRVNMSSPECFIDDSHDDRYVEIKITEVPFHA